MKRKGKKINECEEDTVGLGERAWHLVMVADKIIEYRIDSLVCCCGSYSRLCGGDQERFRSS